ncbi:bifunctional molybdenum cofactor biosynthesis protein MoaC/MoaB [Dietzia psychralcaliphila]|uniref:Cyclic pyranopterin monophosphate synthase n=2 Tax=Dietzia psychralcaliphila TaxID=139021 RepID=A0AAD0JND9_9ACTN|nr:bifunctional molybdenum cofactor biosynthesis protein MoaC/MoaB [Dietzia psychralcaliphila]AWH94282.1 bifunctional molybdenum cofactor biosynthesis protein MoaC/MoaB [Dietzia psychralcaliphila]PTM87886.1 cyclic pyranopterin monophosphate synthase subunit MoaC [Dietzia psychralcaliphila]
MTDAQAGPGSTPEPQLTHLGLTHLDPEGRVRMVDVGDKAVTTRTATAEGVFRTRPEVVDMVAGDDLGKADVLATARLAGIGAAKKTSELIPLCHQIPLNSVKVRFDLDAPVGEIRVSATARTTGRTGVEMEALTAVSVAGLTLHDMVKAVDPLATMDGVRLATKTGGKRGDWTRESDDESARAGTGRPAVDSGRSAVVVVSSTAAAHGRREDTTGPAIEGWLLERDFSPVEVHVVPDADVAAAVTEQVRRSPAVLLTTGGTGVAPDDRTPEATAPHLDLELPGVAEAMRARGLPSTPTAAMSRGLAGFAGRTLVANLPGSTGGVRDGLAVLDELLDHLLAVHAHGGDH